MAECLNVTANGYSVVMPSRVVTVTSRSDGVCHGCQRRHTKGQRIFLVPPPDKSYGWGVFCRDCKPARRQKRGPRPQASRARTQQSDELLEAEQLALDRVLDPTA